MPTVDPVEKATRLAERIKREVERSAGKGLNVAMLFLIARTKEALSVAAPRKAIRGPGGAITGYRATTRATPGAPMRKVSGMARSSLTGEVVKTEGEWEAHIGMNAKSPKGYAYARHHEVRSPSHSSSGKHQSIRPTFERFKYQIAKIMGSQVVLDLRV